MRDTQRFGLTAANIALGGMAILAAIFTLSFGGTNFFDIYFFYIVGLVTWIFAVFIYISKPDDGIAHLFYLMGVALLSIYSVSGQSEPYVEGWRYDFVSLFRFFATAFLPCMFLRCFAVFPEPKRLAQYKLFRRGVYFPGAILAIGMSVSYLFGQSYERLFFIIKMPYFTEANFIFVIVYSMAGHICLLHTCRTCSDLHTRKQAKWLFLGISIGTFPVTIFYTIPSLLGRTFPLGKYSAYTLILVMVCYVIAILRHRLMGIRIALNRSSLYAILSSVMLMIYLAGISLFTDILSLPIPDWVGKIISMLIVAMLFAPMKQRTQNFIDRYFYQREHNYRTTLLNFSEALSNMPGPDTLGDTLLYQLDEAFQPEFAALILRADHEYTVYRQIGDENKLKVVMHNIDFASVTNDFKMFGEEQLTVPLITNRGLIGVILLGKKLSEKNYSSEDISLMQTLSTHAAISIEKYERLRAQVDSMQLAYSRLVETFKKSYPNLLLTENTSSGEKDIIAELDMIAEALIGSSDKLTALNELKSGFLDNVSHELRTPLTAIQGHADNLLNNVLGELNENQRNRIGRISLNCKRLLRMVESLLRLSRIESDRLPFMPENISLSALMEDIALEMTPIAENKKLSLSFHYPPDSLISADEDMLRQIIINLIDNAIKFTLPGGEISINVENADTSTAISVKDTGIGMQPDNLDRIFDRFHQIPNEDGGNTAGLGIGLSIVKTFMDIHNGSIEVQSELEAGSQFTVIFPQNYS